MAKHDIQYAIGEAVIITALKAEGIVVAQLAGSSYRIALGSIHIKVNHAELQPVKARARANLSTTRKAALVAECRKKAVKSSIDLHGLNVDEASRSLEAWLNAAILSNAKHGKVIHGLGTGRLQQATHEILRRYSAVRAFRINEVNPGETDVYFNVTTHRLLRSSLQFRP
jgi:DNA mismatch repair protein MutS2